MVVLYNRIMAFGDYNTAIKNQKDEENYHEKETLFIAGSVNDDIFNRSLRNRS